VSRVTELPGQQSLFQRPAATPFVQRSRTSKQAADSVRPKARTIRDAVLAHTRACRAHGCTDADLFVAFPQFSQSTIRPRRVDLVAEGLVVDSGRTRPTPSGKKAVVWVAV
jgi:hypothetical protein